MPYEHMEEFLGRGDEQFLGPLTVTHLAGGLLGGTFGQQGSEWLGLPLLLSAPATLGLAALGVAATWRVGGLTPLSRGYWLLRFLLLRVVDGKAAQR